MERGVVWDGSPVIILIIAAVIYGVSFLLFSGMWKFILVWRHNPKEMALSPTRRFSLS